MLELTYGSQDAGNHEFGTIAPGDVAMSHRKPGEEENEDNCASNGRVISV